MPPLRDAVRCRSVSGLERVLEVAQPVAAALDAWMASYNEVRTHGCRCFGKMPLQTFLDGVALAREEQQPGRAA